MDKAKTITINGHCRDCFNATLLDKDGKTIASYDGYVSIVGRGDDIYMEIDLETGKILNWVPPTRKELEETFGEIE
jgi:hypothetical protein